MPNNKRKTVKALQGKGKDKVHPGSRKAGQMDRIVLRTSKLSKAGSRRHDINEAKMERPLFFIYSLLPLSSDSPTSSIPLPLPHLKSLIQSFLARHDVEIKELEEKRRPGRAKDVRLVGMEERRGVEGREWESGFEVIDLTHLGTCKLIRKWLDTDVGITHAHLDLLRMVRITPECEAPILAKEGKTAAMGLDLATATAGESSVAGGEGGEEVVGMEVEETA